MESIAKQLIIVGILVAGASVNCDISDVCSTYSGRRIYVEQDGSGHIHAANITTTNTKNVRFFFYRVIVGHLNAIPSVAIA